ncbi:MAG: lysozyme inhibitor LprI family protein [Erythrobacter sp.]
MGRSSSTKSLERVQQQLASKRLRRSSDFIDSDRFDAEDRLSELATAISDFPMLTELQRHVVVSSIACLQTYHRGFLAIVMRHDITMKLRGSDLIGEKYTLNEVLKVAGNEAITVEEIIAHAAPVNSVTDMISWLSKIFDRDFVELIRHAVPPDFRDIPEGAPRIVNDVDQLLAHLSETFELRHILAHEAAPRLELSPSIAARALHAVEQWIDVTQGVLWQTVLRDDPLTQIEMNAVAAKYLQNSSRRLAKAIRRVRMRLTGEKRFLFSRNHRRWKETVMDFSSLSYGSMKGSMWRSINAHSLVKMLDARSADCEDWADYLEMD